MFNDCKNIDIIEEGALGTITINEDTDLYLTKRFIISENYNLLEILVH